MIGGRVIFLARAVLQCSMNDKKAPDERRKADPTAKREDSSGNLMLLGLFIVVVGIGVWLVNALLDARKADECMTQRRRDCAPVIVPSPER